MSKAELAKGGPARLQDVMLGIAPLIAPAPILAAFAYLVNKQDSAILVALVGTLLLSWLVASLFVFRTLNTNQTK